MVNPRRNVDRFAPIPARMVRLTILATNNQTEPCLDELEVYSAATAGGVAAAKRRRGPAPAVVRRRLRSIPITRIHKIAHLNDGQTGNSHSWISNVPGKGSDHARRGRKPATIDRVVWGRDREGVFRDRLATEYYLEVALEPGRWQVVASSLDRVPYDPQTTSGACSGRGQRSLLEERREAARTVRPRSARGSPNWARR